MPHDSKFADFNIKLPIGNNRRVPVCIHQVASGAADVGAYPKSKDIDPTKIRATLKKPFKNGVKHELTFLVRKGAISILQEGTLCLVLTNPNDVVVENGDYVVLEASKEMVVTVSSCFLDSAN
jgi:hypothetical protein